MTRVAAGGGALVRQLLPHESIKGLSFSLGDRDDESGKKTAAEAEAVDERRRSWWPLGVLPASW